MPIDITDIVFLFFLYIFFLFITDIVKYSFDTYFYACYPVSSFLFFLWQLSYLWFEVNLVAL